MTTTLRSNNLTCPSCVAGLEKMLKSIEGVESAAVYFTSGRIEVRHDVARVSAEALVQAVRKAGYEAHSSIL